jgi:hypothetical protein
VTGFFGPDFSVEEVSDESGAFIFQRIERRCWQGRFCAGSNHPRRNDRKLVDPSERTVKLRSRVPLTLIKDRVLLYDLAKRYRFFGWPFRS